MYGTNITRWVGLCYNTTKVGLQKRSIHTAARYGHVGIINTLLQKGEKVDVTTSVSCYHLSLSLSLGKHYRPYRSYRL
ncbi:hypothetical protein J6590_101650 [Homalodisca vitripennis]|nr:hypothetical protein J6590_101650 [Homalodisca vitripennis]